MNDRFRFRAWGNSEGLMPKMIYDVQATYDYCCRGVGAAEDCFQDVLDDDYYIVMQCTGIKDTENTLIYESDIVKDDHDALFYIKWVYNGWEVEPLFENGYTLGLTDELTVVGNIYENPELVKGFI